MSAINEPRNCSSSQILLINGSHNENKPVKIVTNSLDSLSEWKLKKRWLIKQRMLINCKKKKEDYIEIHSDRESSVESFHTNKSSFSTAAESELIDVDDIELSDEESWLYKSPKKLPSLDKTLNTYKWVNKEKDNLEVQDTKDALVRKLNQLQTRNAVKERYSTGDNFRSKEVSGAHDGPVSNVKLVPKTNSSFNTEVSKQCTGTIPSNAQDSVSVKGKENDVLDVHKIAQLQEESLRQSTQRFLDLVEKRGHSDKNCFLKSKLSKPASVEAINVCNGKLDDETVYTSLLPMQTMKKHNYFGSSSFLHQQDAHRGSLPNINPGYFSLRSKKSKKSLDQKLACPLPLSPHSRLPLNGAGFHASSSVSQFKLTSPLTDYCESRTLPSSYRIHSRSNPSSRKDLSTLSPSPRRESTPFLSNPRSSSVTRRDSAPGSNQKYISPVSSPTLYQRNNSSSSYLQSPHQSRRNPPKDLKTVPPNAENTSHSPSSRRMPLSTVHNCSPKRANSPASPRKEDLKGFKLSSKVPSPGPSVRSGIPVPSSYSTRMASDDESWSHDCF